MSSSPTVEIVKAIADAKGVRADELEISLQEHIDADAIELLADHDALRWTLSFELPNHTVQINGDGLVIVDGVQERSWE